MTNRQGGYIVNFQQKQVDTYKALPDSTKEMIAGLSKRFELTEGEGLG